MSKQIHNPAQGELFTHNAQIHTESPTHQSGLAVLDHNPSLHDPNPGPFVDVLERNAHMQNLMKHLGSISRAAGVDMISSGTPRRKLERQYRSGVDEVVGNTGEKSRRDQIAAKQEYAKAFGLEALISSGLMDADEAKAFAAASYSKEVIPVFADAKGARNRDNMKSWMNYQERKITGQRTAKPKHPRPKSPEVV